MKLVSTAVMLPLALFLALSAQAMAEPLVLYDSGQTIDITPFMKPLRPKPQAGRQLPPAPSFAASGYGLPVETPSMTPGRVPSRSLPMLQGKMAGARPLFLIGADQWSLQWLQQNQPRLVELQAVGMVVSVETERDLNVLRQAAGSLPLMPASGEVVALHLGLQHYPVLIAPPGIIAQ